MSEWSSPYGGLVYAAAAAGIVALVVVARRLAISEHLRRWVLFVPRVLVLGLILVILLNPVWKQEHRLPAQPPQVDFVVDASRSMAFDQPNSRSTHVQAVIQGIDKRGNISAQPKVQLYRFGERLSSASDLAALRPSDD